MERNLSPELIRKYLSGECSPEEAVRVREWYDSFEGEPDPLCFLSQAERDALKELMYDEVMQRLRAQKALPRLSLFSGKRRYLLAGGAAAALLLFFGLSALFERTPPPDPISVSSGKVAPHPHQETANREVLVENTLKTIRRQALPDGSVVWLKPETWISFPEKFAPGTREVSMEGEAFFEVSADPSRPFIVYSGDLVTRVLGTSFNIKAYKNGTSAEVSVFTGKVSVSLPSLPDETGRTELQLVKDEKAVFMQEKKLLKKQSYSISKQPELNIWKKNTISFDNTPVNEVVKVLNSEFDVEMKVAKKDRELNNYILKADFTNQNLPDILQMLERSLSLTYEIDGKEIILKLDK